jgi:hypothetical protein
MHKDRPPAVLIRKIGISWKAINMLSKPESQSMDGGSRQDFRFGIARSDPRHHFGARKRRALPAGQDFCQWRHHA